MTKITKYQTRSYEVEIPNTLERFKTWEFSSGCTTGQDFKAFVRLFRSWIKKNLPVNAELVPFKGNHYCLSGFIKRDKAGLILNKYVYFSISDVRFFPGEWHKNILIRTAEHDKDWGGGSNCYTKLDRFKKDVDILLTTGKSKGLNFDYARGAYESICLQ